MSNTILYGFTQKDLEKTVKLVIKELRKSNLNSTSLSPTTKNDKLSQREAAEFLGVTVQTIMNWKKKGIIPFYQVENSIFFLKSELLECARKNSSLRQVSSK